MRKKILLGLLAVLLTYLLVLWSEWLPRTTPAQQAAQALLQQPLQRAQGQHDAFPLLWSLSYDMPEAERANLLATDQKAYAQMEAAGKAVAFKSTAQGRYPEAWPEKSELCPPAQTGDCLTHVRANLEQIRATVALHAGLLSRATALRDSDHAHYGFRPSMVSPLPSLGIGPLQVTASALEFVEGRPEAALDGACSDLASWRRLRSHTDMLLLDMVGVAFVDEEAALLASMLAELPADRPLPASCSAALAAPVAGETDQCDVWRGEYASTSNTIGGFSSAEMAMVAGREPGISDRLSSLLLNERATLASFAPYYAQLCQSGGPQPFAPPGVVSQIFNPAGSAMLETAVPDYSGYRQRVQDMLVIVQGLRTVTWLRSQADPVAAFAQRPQDMKTPDREITLDADGRHLRIPLLQPRNGMPKEWLLPLPASRSIAASPLQAAGAD